MEAARPARRGPPTDLLDGPHPGAASETIGPGSGRVALSELMKAISLGGRAPQLFDDTGAMLEHAGRVKEAVLAYSKGLERAPTTPSSGSARWAYEAFGRHNDALTDFKAAARSDPANAEAHTGVGYERSLLKLPNDAQLEAELALLHGAENYLILHNVACIYASLSENADHQATDYQDVAMALIQRAVKVWKQGEANPSEIDLIKSEPAFKTLHGRADFQELITKG